MKKYAVLLLCLLGLLLMNVAGASYLDYPETYMTQSEWRDDPYINVSFGDSGYLYTLDMWIDSPVLVQSDNIIMYLEDDLVFSGLVYNSSLDGNGDGYVSTPEDTPFPYIYDYNGDGDTTFLDTSYWSAHVEYSGSWINNTIDEFDLPWDNCNYTVNYTLKYYTNGTTALSGSEWFWFGDYDDSIDYYFAITQCEPHHLDFYGANALKKVSFSCISNDENDKILHIIVTDNDRSLKAYGQRSVYFNGDDDGLVWQVYDVKPDVYQLYTSYYNYYGFATAGFTWSNTEISLDETSYYTNFSLDYVDRVNDLFESHVKDHDYIGCGLWFETAPSTDDDLAGWTPDVPDREGSLGDMIDSWANDPAVWGGTPPMPWFKYVVAVILIVICTCIPFGFSLRTDIELPTFIYGVAVTIGVFICFGLELIDLWITVFYILILIFTIILTYREQLEDAYERLTPYGSKLREEAKGVKGAVERYSELGRFKTAGERRRSLREKRKHVTSMNITHVKNNKRIPRATRDSTGKVYKNYSDSYAKKMEKAGYKQKGDYWVKGD